MKYSQRKGKKHTRVDRQFWFEFAEIRAHSGSASTWHAFVRSSEVEIVLSALENRRFNRALEIGAGDGLQSEVLAARCETLVCTDVDRQQWDNGERWSSPDNVSFILMDVTDLSRFADDSFDLVYSSNVLEHIEDVDRCIHETHRVLKPSGIGVHSVPSRFWKLFNSLYRLARCRMPKIHGVQSTNWQEFVSWGLADWIRKFEGAGFAIERIYGMPFYFGASGRYSALVGLGNRFRFPSSYTLFVRPTPGGRGQGF